MDEESIGLLGVLLIVTGLVVSHQVHTSGTLPLLHQVHWPNVAEVLGCKAGEQNCAVAMAR